MRYVTVSLLSDLSGVPEDEVLPDWVIAADPTLHYIPMELHTKMSPGFYRGYLVVVDAMTQILQQPPGAACVPAPPAVTARVREMCREAQMEAGARPAAAMSVEEVDDVETFFGVGGKVEFALEALTDRAKEKSPEGSEYRRKKALEQEEEEFEKEVRDLPMCSNDLDFELVRTRLGLPAKSIGPHWFFLTDSEEEDDYEEDEGDEEVVYTGVQADKDGAFMKRRE